MGSLRRLLWRGLYEENGRKKIKLRVDVRDIPLTKEETCRERCFFGSKLKYNERPESMYKCMTVSIKRESWCEGVLEVGEILEKITWV